jgi:hypothetical protein
MYASTTTRNQSQAVVWLHVVLHFHKRHAVVAVSFPRGIACGDCKVTCARNKPSQDHPGLVWYRPPTLSPSITL